MACGSCAKKRAAKLANVQTTQVPTEPVVQDTSMEFVRKRYIGPNQRLLSVNEQFSYGMRQTNEVLIIMKVDFEAHPEWWEDV